MENLTVHTYIFENSFAGTEVVNGTDTTQFCTKNRKARIFPRKIKRTRGEHDEV